VAHPQLAAILRLQWWVGSRPSELLRLRVRDVQRTGTLRIPKVAPVELGDDWAAHISSKMARLGHVRCLMFGPRSQAIIGPILDSLKPDDFVFSPRRTGEQFAASKDCYSRVVVNNALIYAAEKIGRPKLTMQSIRHACSERIVREMGDKAEQAALGHDSGSKITRRYAGWDSTLAAEVARKCG
jgi:integrase